MKGYLNYSKYTALKDFHLSLNAVIFSNFLDSTDPFRGERSLYTAKKKSYTSCAELGDWKEYVRCEREK